MKTFLVTGANRGIGLEYCRQLQERGDRVIATCRTPSADLEALGIRIEAGLDHCNDAAITGLVERLAGLPIDALLEQLKAGAKLALMSSRMGSIDDNSSGGSYGYRMAKVALNMAGKSLAIDLRARGIAVAILHPGLVRTRMVNFNPQGISPEQAVRGLLARIDALTLDNSGTFWHANGEVLPW
jgi:NAD(P)-dependent dehydrogenase (short-subunit alcohol dehydrogenase family)